ncbi:MAG: STT3 domain-containing protein [Sulfurovaceae bacterium]|nr:STT3 domain-containing protein [Sulfurovaceae bacterium]
MNKKKIAKSVPEQEVSTKMIALLMLLAYAFGVLMRFIWIYQYSNESSFIWNNEFMLTTNDGYYFAAGVQNLLDGSHALNPRLWDMWHQGTIWVSALIVWLSPFTLETTLFYMPIFVSSLIAIPLVLIGSLYGRPMWGFMSAILGVIAWSYYNRTMAGYYDTDMFAIWLPMFALYFLLRSIEKSSWNMVFYASIVLVLYSFIYTSSKGVIYSLGLTYLIYKFLFYRKEHFTYKAAILLIVALLPFGNLTSSYTYPYGFLVQLGVLSIIYVIFSYKEFSQKSLIMISIIMFAVFLYFGNVYAIIAGKILGYMAKGTTSEGLHFFEVVQTVQEASPIDFITMANRISGSVYGFIIAIIGLIILVRQHRSFWIALPLLAIGMFSLVGGLRFTVYATGVAALGAAYFLVWLADYLSHKWSKYAVLVLGVIVLLLPNMIHIYEYNMPTVFTNQEVEDLNKIKNISKNGDITLAWWDYGYPIWYYTGTSTLIDGGKHHDDNFVISKIMLSPSQQFVYNMSVLATEEYFPFAAKLRDVYFGKGTEEGRLYQQLDYMDVIDVIFKNKQKNQLSPGDLLISLEDKAYPLPKKTRDIYIYMPYRMMQIFPTIASFGDVDLVTGKNANDMQWVPTTPIKQEGSFVYLNNGIVMDTQNGMFTFNGQQYPIKIFTEVDNNSVKKQEFSSDSDYAVVYTKFYNSFIIMDADTYDSAYVQMFLLGKYDHDLFELVVSSPYSKIYRLKR